ncbi:Insulin-like domain-containing protein [Strongyloides ratti]|uniref:Insulin-like domain-containing protein n=1 Tax=Strongyloides ratti TaxID=34506 RepID=A0A090LU22_STRRB|nr:Insulin-like domain-containing protein [Strongyloides ratti]CEF71134.1 Insulin-like domain-containing protein [Strongyloides ratti]
MLKNLFTTCIVILFVISNFQIDGSYTRFVYNDDVNGIRVCGFQLSQFFSKWCHNYKVHLEKTIGVENTMKMNYKSLNKKIEPTNDEQKYLYGKLTEFCCTHRCNSTTLEKLCIPRLNIF